MAPDFQPWITRIDPNCGLLGSLHAVTRCVSLFLIPIQFEY